MFLVSLVAVSVVLVKAIDTASAATLSSYANICLYPLALSAIKLKLTLFPLSGSI
jgi:hypothetical protein